MIKTAVIVDSRLCKELKKSIEKHMSFLKGWNLIHITDSNIKTFEDYQRLFLNVHFWKSLKVKKVLIFQKDSEILKNGIEEFLYTSYSFIGAPWAKTLPWGTSDRRGGNGGISIRDVEQHIKTLRKTTAEQIFEQHRLRLLKKGLTKPPGKGLSEDVWLSHNLPNVAPYDVCKKFSVETEFQMGTICAHAIDRHLTKIECFQIRSQYQKWH